MTGVHPTQGSGLWLMVQEYYLAVVPSVVTDVTSVLFV